MKTIQIKTEGIALNSVSEVTASALEKQLIDIASLTGWIEARHNVEHKNGFRVIDRVNGNIATVLEKEPPLIVTGSNGKLVFQTSYGNDFSETDRGELRTSTRRDLISEAGFTIACAVRVPTVASGESATLGGNVWCSNGIASDVTPGLNISGSTGIPIFRAAGATISNPGGFDARTGNWHVIRCAYNAATTTITTNIDGNRATGSNGAASTPFDGSEYGMLAPLLFGSLRPDGVFANPFYGQCGAMMFFNESLDATNSGLVDDYLSITFGATLVP